MVRLMWSAAALPAVVEAVAAGVAGGAVLAVAVAVVRGLDR
jgi:hypothetical protein